MNKPTLRSRGNPTPGFLWVVSTLFLGFILIFASIPPAGAQGSQAEGRGGSQEAKRYVSILQYVFDFIQDHYVDEVDPKVVFEGAMTGMFQALGDPYSAFLPESDMMDLSDTTKGTFGGVGLYISKPSTYVEVAAPIEDTPGWRAGINPGDLIISIDGEDTANLSLEEVLSRLRGEPGKQVALIIRRGTKLEFPVTLTRAVIEVPTVKHAMIGDTGYLRLLTFTPMSLQRTRDALADFKKQGYRSLILDLRNNYGGLLQSAVGISDLFLEGGVVVSTKSRLEGESAVFTAANAVEVPANIPMVVLINRGSASASEIVAGALKDRGRAYLVGEKSFGKGSVQQVYPLDKAGFRITTARYYTPSDVNIDKIGIPPDKEILFPEFSDDDGEKLDKLMKAGSIPAFVEANPQATAAEVDAFASKLRDEYGLDLSLLKRLVRNEQNRTVIAPVYDLEYDLQLQGALDILRSADFLQLLRTTKTLKDLQDEAAKDAFPQES